MNNNIVVGTDLNFDQEVLSSSKPVLVDFWAPWCGPCRMVAPIVDELANELNGKLKVVKLNTDENFNIASRYGIMSIPTLGIFKNGRMVETVIGAVPKHYLMNKISPHIEKVH